MQNAFESNERQKLWVSETFKIEIQKRAPINSHFLQNWFPQKLDPTSLICRNFNTLTKGNAESYRLH